MNDFLIHSKTSINCSNSLLQLLRDLKTTFKYFDGFFLHKVSLRPLHCYVQLHVSIHKLFFYFVTWNIDYVPPLCSEYILFVIGEDNCLYQSVLLLRQHLIAFLTLHSMFHLFNADKKLIDAEGVLKGLKETVNPSSFICCQLTWNNLNSLNLLRVELHRLYVSVFD